MKWNGGRENKIGIEIYDGFPENGNAQCDHCGAEAEYKVVVGGTMNTLSGRVSGKVLFFCWDCLSELDDAVTEQMN